jgi:hypothetical protein
MDSRYQAVLDMSKPRNVRLSKRGRLWVLWLALPVCAVEAGILVSLYFSWMQLKSVAELVRVHGVAFYGVFFIPILPLCYRRVLLRQKNLLANGEIAVATVTQRIHDMRMRAFYVKYRFTVHRGDLAEGKCLDPTELLREGSTMLVYYDPDNLDNKVGQCEAYYEIPVSGDREDYVDAVG